VIARRRLELVEPIGVLSRRRQNTGAGDHDGDGSGEANPTTPRDSCASAAVQQATSPH
jgi:hypothetical protein